MKRQSHSEKNTQLCMWLVMEVNSNAVKSNTAQEPGILGPWIKANWKWSNKMARVNINILGISELKWTGMGEFNSDDHYIYSCGQESLRRNGPNIPGSYAILFFIASDSTSITSHIHIWALFPLWLCLFILSGVIFPLFSSSVLGTYWPGEVIFQCYNFFAFSYCSWGSQGNTELVCHSLLQWTTFCQNSLPWPIHLCRILVEQVSTHLGWS